MKLKNHGGTETRRKSNFRINKPRRNRDAEDGEKKNHRDTEAQRNSNFKINKPRRRRGAEKKLAVRVQDMSFRPCGVIQSLSFA